MNLRPYQNNCLAAIEGSHQRVNRSLVAMPTGTGKTVVFATHIDREREAGIVSPAAPAVIIAHREELLTQAREKLHAVNPFLRIGTEQANQKCQGNEEVIVASVQTIGREGTRRLRDVRPSLIIVDEAHHAAARTYGIALRNLGAFEGAKVLGFTATPKRLDRQAIHSMDGAVFEEVAFNYGIRQAIADGWLCQIRGFRVQTDVDLDDLRTVAGDWVDADVAKAVDTENRTKASVSRWREVAGDRKTIVFCASVDHAYHAASLWASYAKGVEVIHGKLQKDARHTAFENFKSGRSQVLCNVDIATEGFDCPDVSSIVMLRPTQSWARYVQCVGRGTRICPGKEDLIVIDVVDNCKRHSLATVPAILDLPPGLDLKGKSLEEAAKKMERLGGAGGALLARIDPKTIDEVDSLLQRIDLLANIETPEKIAPLTHNNWLQQPNGGFFLACGAKDGRQLTAWLNEDALGLWHLKQSGDGRAARLKAEQPSLPLGADLPAALRFADSIIRSTWPDSGGVTSRMSKWRRSSDPPTEKQINMLKYLGYNASALPNLTKALASNLISQGKAR